MCRLPLGRLAGKLEAACHGDCRRGNSDKGAATHRGDQQLLRESHGGSDSGRPERPRRIEGAL